MLAARQVVTLFLIATLIPAPGLAWPAPRVRRADRGAWTDAHAQRVFWRALNATDQSPMAGPNRPQLYLVSAVNVAVPPSGTAAVTDAQRALLADVVKELETGAAATVAATTAAATTATSAKLAAMPGAVNTDQQSARIALDEALVNAGLDNNGTFRVHDDGSVTYQDTLSDGDLTITVAKDGALTKTFTPVTDGVNPQGTQSGGIQVSPTASTVVNNTVTGNTAAPQPTGVSAPNASPGARTPTYSDTLRRDLEAKVKVITPNSTNAALMGQILIRDTYNSQLDYTATAYENLLKDASRLDSTVRDLRSAAGAVADAYQNMRAAELAVGDARVRTRTDQKGYYETQLREAERLEQAGSTVAADKIRQDANDSVYALFLRRQQTFYTLLDANPMLGLGNGGSDYLFLKLRNTLPFNAPNSDYVTLVRPYLVEAAEEAREEITRVAGFTSADEFVEFGGPKYERTRDAVGDVGDANGTGTPRILANGAVGPYLSENADSVVTTEITNFGLNVVAGGAWIIPGVGPFISAGAAAIQVVRDGNQLVIAVLDEKDARNLAGVTGYTRVLTAEDKVAAQKDAFAISVAGLVLEGLQGVRVVKGPVKPGAGNAATDAAGTAGRNTPPPANSPRTVAGAGDPPKTTGPAREPKPQELPKAEQDALLADELAEDIEVYNNNLKDAQAAGVSPDRIKELTAKGDPGDVDVSNALYREARLAEGKQIDMPTDEYIMLKQLDVRNKNGILTEADYQFLRDKLAADPNYLDKVPDRGRLTFVKDKNGNLPDRPTDEFDPSLSTGQRDDLLKDPRVAQMVDEAKAAGPRPAAASVEDTTGTVTLPGGGRPGAVEDTTGTVIVPAGARPSTGTPTVKMDPNKTALTPPPGVGTPTVKMDPTKTALVDNADTTPTVRLDPNKTVSMDPNKTALTPPPNVTTPTVKMDPSKTALVDNADTTPTVKLDAGKTTRDLSGTTLDPNKTTLDPNRTVITPPSAAPLVDPDATVRMADEMVLRVPKMLQSGLSPQQIAANLRVAASKFGVGPRQLASRLHTRLVSPRSVSMADIGNAQASATTRDVRVSMEALGVSSGVAFTLRTTNSGTLPIQVQGEGIVVEPVSGPPAVPGLVREGASQSQSANRADAIIAPQVVTEQVEAFCLERERPVAPAGTQYRVAPPALQAQHRGMVNVLHAAKRVMDLGGLRPDSEIKSYFNFIRQWSIWSRQENFDQSRFTEEFVNQTKKNVEGQGVKWTDVMRDTVRKAAPGRWRDIVSVLEAAKGIATRASLVNDIDLTQAPPRDARQVAVVRRFSPAPPRLRSVVI